MPLLLSSLIVSGVVTAVGSYLFYACIGLAGSYGGVIIAHPVLDSRFVVVSVGASLTGFDRNPHRAAAISGARPLNAFFRVLPSLILPGALPVQRSPS
jgi:putative spermidine/putrescine transport system permease protein